jgi:hypothetical protein
MPGCGDATLLAGNPLTGQGTIHTTGATSTSRAATNPRGFTIIASDLYVDAQGSLTYIFPYLFTKVYANLRNQRGVFCESCGPGRYSSSPRFTFTGPGPIGQNARMGRLGISPGANKFGGTMKLLGTMYSKSLFDDCCDTYLSTRTWLFDYIGASASASGGNITAPAFGQDYVYYWGRHGIATGTDTVQAFAISWTTGTVTVTGGGNGVGPFTTIMARAGFDNRDPKGYGEIQMVSPMLTRWIYRSGNRTFVDFTGGIGIMRIHFTPEPHAWMLLGAGLSLLGLLYRANRRSR